MRRIARASAFVAVVAFALACAAAETKTTGVVLMHGWGLQGKDDPVNPFAYNWLLSKHLRDAGYRVAEEELPWGPRRLLDVPLDAAMREVDGQVANLRAAGARTIVIAGFSMGAAMAIAYAAQREGVAGVVALAPGHHPELQAAFFPDVAPAQLRKAREAIARGRGNEPMTFSGVNCCFFFREFTTTPAAYLSYYDPAGAAPMGTNVAKLRPGTSILLVYGTADAIGTVFPRAGLAYVDYAWQRLPPGVRRERVLVDGNHGSVPSLAVPHVMRWLAELPE